MEQKKSVQMNLTKLVDKSVYNQWERQGLNGISREKPTSCSTRTKTTVSPGPSITTRQQQIKKRTSVRQTTAEQESEERTRILELKILSSRAAISNHKTREQELITDNLQMKEAILMSEKPDHEAVKGLMRRYEKFRGGISFLSENFTSTLKREEKLLDDLQTSLENEFSVIQREVNSLDQRLQQKQNHVYILNNYKDKEYPVKAIRIGELMTELDQVEMNNDDEFYDLERIIDGELHKLNRAGNDAETNIKESALNTVLDQMHPSLREMARQNQVMQSEINYHEAEMIQLRQDIESLEEEVKDLISQPTTNVRLQVFPELFKYDTKCTPDMDIVLDIPTVKPLPI